MPQSLFSLEYLIYFFVPEVSGQALTQSFDCAQE